MEAYLREMAIAVLGDPEGAQDDIDVHSESILIALDRLLEMHTTESENGTRIVELGKLAGTVYDLVMEARLRGGI